MGDPRGSASYFAAPKSRPERNRDSHRKSPAMADAASRRRPTCKVDLIETTGLIDDGAADVAGLFRCWD
ncbi:hypothetical protein K239x_20130 [Planctomycetes bacterium K23_9]|uniref:Uncharacterized protein n=1 Tax=Stieleria marina TaxID=1930275 RepID=A0A517NSF7_9BACT|nr:hypothetical protein K239x_20130 [Planctomycetes bacterium K23_9]